MISPLNILIIDSPTEIVRFKRAIKTLPANHTIMSATTIGEAGARFAMHPEIIVFNPKLPFVNGIAFLKAVKKDKTLCCVPVIVLTDSGSRDELVELYRLGISGYMIKPADDEEYTAQVKILLDYSDTNQLVSK